MFADSISTTRQFRLIVCVTVLTAGQNLACVNEVCPENTAAQLQISPSGRGVAFINPETFERVLGWLSRGQVDSGTSFDCLVDDFTRVFDNDVDFVVMVMDMTREEFRERAADSSTISNFTVVQRVFESGTGNVQLPFPAPAGPASMRAYIFLGIRDGLVAGPSLHEIAHGWSAYLNGPESLASQLNREPLRHWGFTSVGGVLGGWDATSLEAQSEGLYHACAPSSFELFAPQGYANNNISYAPLELYLMGLIPPDEVPDIDVAVNPQIISQDGSCVTFSADAIETVTIDDVIAANGPRVPSHDESQKHFSMALLVIADHALSDEEWMVYEQAMLCLESSDTCPVTTSNVSADNTVFSFIPFSFSQATGLRASMRFGTLELSDEFVTQAPRGQR